MAKLKEYNLLVMASTYPRWANDSMRTFVQDFVFGMADSFKAVKVIVPHYKGARHREQQKANVSVTRFYYAVPTSLENVAYGEFKLTKPNLLKMPFYVGSELLSTFFAALRKRPVILNPHWIIPQGFVAVLLKPVLRTKVVVSVHGADVYTLNGGFLKKIKRFVLSHADAVVANSSATEAECKKLFSRDYHVIPMGVDTSLFTARSPKPASRIFELLFVGRLDEKKGVRYLCEATKLLIERNIAVHTTIVGDGDTRKELEDYVLNSGLEQAITFTGGLPHEQVAAHYAKADAFVGPSIQSKTGWQEAFGLVFAEASATGVPVIATATGGISDIVKDGVNGLTVPQKDASAIADAVEKLIRDQALCQKLGANGPDFIRQNFAWPVIIEKYKAVFENLLTS
jgi:glycosyltransferase involved in cell wall biosynthesis